MSEYRNLGPALRKPMHPKVIKVLARLSCLSPSIIPRDTHQPKQGCLALMKKQQSSFVLEQKNQETRKPDTVLNLSSSLLSRRKLSMSVS
jgi:hypothetical protein